MMESCERHRDVALLNALYALLFPPPRAPVWRHRHLMFDANGSSDFLVGECIVEEPVEQGSLADARVPRN